MNLVSILSLEVWFVMIPKKIEIFTKGGAFSFLISFNWKLKYLVITWWNHFYHSTQMASSMIRCTTCVDYLTRPKSRPESSWQCAEQGREEVGFIVLLQLSYNCLGLFIPSVFVLQQNFSFSSLIFGLTDFGGWFY